MFSVSVEFGHQFVGLHLVVVAPPPAGSAVPDPVAAGHAADHLATPTHRLLHRFARPQAASVAVMCESMPARARAPRRLTGRELLRKRVQKALGHGR